MLKTIAVALMAVFLCSTANAQQFCGQRDAMLKAAEEKYKEVPRHRALSSDGAMIEVLVSEEGTWTVVVSLPDGTACVRGSGAAWENLTPEPVGPKA